MYVCVCESVHIEVCVYVCLCLHVCFYVRAYVHACMHVCACVCACVGARVCACLCLSACSLLLNIPRDSVSFIFTGACPGQRWRVPSNILVTASSILRERQGLMIFICPRVPAAPQTARYSPSQTSNPGMKPTATNHKQKKGQDGS